LGKHHGPRASSLMGEIGRDRFLDLLDI
jgi:lysyl-tRNA synthetase class I